MILVDSSVLIDYFNGADTWSSKVLDNLLGNEIVAIGDYIMTEVLQGFRSEGDFRKAKNILREFPCYNLLGTDLAVKSAENYRKLRKKGVTVRKTIDVVIATFCIENNFSLLHSDRDFKPFEEHLGLKVISKPM